MRRWTLGWIAGVCALAVVGGCGSDDPEAATTTTLDAETAVTGTITVYAAASLTDAFTEIGEAFEAEHPDTAVTFNFAGSSALATQITQGAPADLFASADTKNVEGLVTDELIVGDPEVFTRNELAIVVGQGNPLGITALADLARADVVTVLCAPDVPCGNYARQALAKAGVDVTPRSDEQNVAALVGRVASGEADAGIAYVTDVAADERVDGVTIPPEHNVEATYPIVQLLDSPNPDTAQEFLTFVLGEEGQRILGEHGFLPK